MAFSAPTTHEVLSKRNNALKAARQMLSAARRGKNESLDITVPSVATNRKLSEKIRKLRDELKIEREHRKLLEDRLYSWKASNSMEPTVSMPLTRSQVKHGRVSEDVSHAPRNNRQYLHTRELEKKLIERSTQLQVSSRLGTT